MIGDVHYSERLFCFIEMPQELYFGTYWCPQLVKLNNVL